jgi:ribonucleoside-diphosphate reductase alpha subunit
MFVVKRNGSQELVSFDKITERLSKLVVKEPKLLNTDPIKVSQKVVSGVYSGVSTRELDNLAAETAAFMSTIHPNYDRLASRIVVSNLHKETNPNYLEVAKVLYEHINTKTNEHAPLISKETYLIIQKHNEIIQRTLNYELDYFYDYFGFKTLEKSYLIKIGRQVIERPQHTHMRVAIGIHGDNIDKIIKTYTLLSQGFYTHATPTIFNAGTNYPQLSSCFLLSMESDSIDGIYSTLKKAALISKHAGGIGISISNIRASQSYIKGTNGTSNGIVPMLRVINDTARYVDQCVVPNTGVYTTKGIMRICDTVEGETKIFNSDGYAETIKNVLEYQYNGDIINIEVNNTILRITPQHPIKIMPQHSREIEWTEAQYVEEGDFIAYKVPEYYYDQSDISEDDAYMYGIILKYGTINKYEDYDAIVCEDSHIIDFVQEYFHNKCIKLYNTNDSKLQWNKTNSLHFKRQVMYNNEEKIINDRWLNLPLNKAKYIIKPFLFANKYSKTVKVNADANLYHYVNYILMKMGILIDMENNITITNEINELLGISFPLTEQRTVDGYLLSRVNLITSEPYKGKVYDLQMSQKHNYMLTSGLVHNGGGKRKGAFAIYLEPWHADIQDFLELKKNNGKEEMRCRDLFYGLWIPDLFMKRVEENQKWSLMCPHECPRLYDTYGEEFEQLYTKYEREGRYRKQINAQDLWFQIINSQIETGMPYTAYKDACNSKSNQKNLGTIRNSNLCIEIMEYSSADEIAVCNLASIATPMFVSNDDFDKSKSSLSFNHQKLYDVAYHVAENLNKLIDVNYYPVPETKTSNLRHRPIGIGIQGLADTFIKLRMPFDSPEAKQLNKEIFETIYFAAATASMDAAKRDGSYSTFVGSPASKGQLCPDMWNVEPSPRWDFKQLRSDIVKYGMRNSLLTTCMPTASTSQILGNNECIEPFTTNIYSRRVLAGEFTIINKHLINDLIDRNLWCDSLKNEIISKGGSVQGITAIPQDIQLLYRTVWELKMRDLVDMSADRAAFIDQSQSFNVFMETPTKSKLTSFHFYAWKKGLKTGMYYLRTRPAVNAIQFTVNQEMLKEVKKEEDNVVCSMEDGCLMCGS